MRAIPAGYLAREFVGEFTISCGKPNQSLWGVISLFITKVKMTLEIYAQAVTPPKREAQSRVAGLLKAWSK